jgi:hypothetical protein
LRLFFFASSFLCALAALREISLLAPKNVKISSYDLEMPLNAVYYSGDLYHPGNSSALIDDSVF